MQTGHGARLRLLLLTAFCTLALVPAAHAATATLSLNGTTLTVTGDGGANKVKLSSSFDGWILISTYPDSVAPPAGCQANYAYEAKCPAGSVTAVIANLGEGNDEYAQYVSGIADTINGDGGDDSITGAVAGDSGAVAVDHMTGGPGKDEISAGSGSGTTCDGGDGDDIIRCYYVPAGGTTTVSGGPGVDELIGGDSDDTLNGDAGNDNRISGGKGNDTINGGDGDDGPHYLYGGLDGGEGADDIRGGAGIDELSEDRNEDRTQYWSLDDVANDGQDSDASGSAEEGDNVHSDVENVETGFDDDVIVGSAANNKIGSGTLGDDKIYGLGGDDDLVGGTSGLDLVDGGDGNDKVAGNGNLVGGNGNDELTGYGDNGLLQPGPGVDSVSAGGGNDVVQSADGEVDTIGCGVGADIAEVDQLDVVNTNDPGENCESVKITQTSVPVNPNGTGNPNASATQLILGTKGSFKGSVATFKATAPGAGIIAATVRPAGRARASAAKARVLGKAMKAISAAGPVALKVRLKGKAARKLKRRKSFKVKLTTVFTPVGGKAGKPVSRTVTLKRK